MMLKTGMEVSKYYTVFNYIPSRIQKDINPQDKIIVVGPGVYLAQTFFLPGKNKKKVGKEPPPNMLIKDNLEKLLAKTVDKARENASGAIL